MPKLNKTVIITGAGGGIGKVIANEFAKKGYALILMGIDLKDLENCAKEIEPITSKFKLIPIDVTNYSKIEKVFAKNLKKGYYVLINTAGVIKPIGPFESNNIVEWIKCIEINLIGTANMIHAILPYMKHPKGGTIINFSGGGAFYGRPDFTAYSTSKSAIVRFSESLASELVSRKIRVHAVSPGAINTKLFTDMLKAGEKNVGKSHWDSLQKQKVTGGDDPKNVAELCLWLDSNKSKPLSGKALSAVYDNWRNWSKKELSFFAKSDWYTMRRFDPYTVKKLLKI